MSCKFILQCIRNISLTHEAEQGVGWGGKCLTFFVIKANQPLNLSKGAHCAHTHTHTRTHAQWEKREWESKHTNKQNPSRPLQNSKQNPFHGLDWQTTNPKGKKRWRGEGSSTWTSYYFHAHPPPRSKHTILHTSPLCWSDPQNDVCSEQSERGTRAQHHQATPACLWLDYRNCRALLDAHLVVAEMGFAWSTRLRCVLVCWSYLLKAQFVGRSVAPLTFQPWLVVQDN